MEDQGCRIALHGITAVNTTFTVAKHCWFCYRKAIQSVKSWILVGYLVVTDSVELLKHISQL